MSPSILRFTSSTSMFLARGCDRTQTLICRGDKLYGWGGAYLMRNMPSQAVADFDLALRCRGLLGSDVMVCGWHTCLHRDHAPHAARRTPHAARRLRLSIGVVCMFTLSTTHTFRLRGPTWAG
jgi:hypothetical protein